MDDVGRQEERERDLQKKYYELKMEYGDLMVAETRDQASVSAPPLRYTVEDEPEIEGN